MYNHDLNAHARAVIDDRIRDASHRRLAREAQHREDPAGTALPVPQAPRHSYLWNLVHFHHAHGAYGLPS